MLILKNVFYTIISRILDNKIYNYCFEFIEWVTLKHDSY